MAKNRNRKTSRGLSSLATVADILGGTTETSAETGSIPVVEHHGDQDPKANISLGDDFPREEPAEDAALAAEESETEVIHEIASILGVEDEVIREAIVDDNIDPDALNASQVDQALDVPDATAETIQSGDVGSLEEALGDAAIQSVLADDLEDALVHDDPSDDEGDNFDPDAEAIAAIEGGDQVRDEHGLDIGGGAPLGDETEEPEVQRTPEQQRAHDDAQPVAIVERAASPEPIRRHSRIAPVAEQVLKTLQAGSASVKAMAEECGVIERDIRLAIDRLRAKGEKIERLGPGVFGFREQKPVRIQGSPVS